MFFRKLVTIAVLSFLAELIFPWWSIAIAAFAVNIFWSSRPPGSFFSGFFGVGLLWFGYAFYVDWQTDAILTGKIAELFMLPKPIFLLIVTGVIGGLVGGFSGLSASYLKALFERKRRESYYIR